MRQVKGIADSHYAQVIAAMHDVVHGQRGTARAISKDLQYQMAGKTGTAQVVGIPQGARYDEDKLAEFQRDHSLFVGFAPLESPKIALSVIVENGGSGSKAAAPIARTVMDQYLLDESDVSKDGENLVTADVDTGVLNEGTTLGDNG